MAKRRNYRQNFRSYRTRASNYARRTYRRYRKPSFFKKYKTILVTALIGLVVYISRDKIKSLFPYLNK